MSRSYHKHPLVVVENGRFELRYGVKQYRGFDGASYRRPRKPHRSCGLCHMEKVYRLRHQRDVRLTQDDVQSEVDRYWEER